jgi:tRNA (cmo5U34)-methyltransferase
MTEKQDTLFSRNRSKTSEFRFDQQVVAVFPDMISRSVPGYEWVVPMIAMLARRYAQQDSNIYDLGCSLGAVSLAISGAVRNENNKIIAVDNSDAMVESCRAAVDRANSGIPVEVRQEDIMQTRIENASVVVLNYTLQFLDRAQRQALITRIAKGMKPGGALIISEKICFEDAAEQHDQTEWHHDFKRAQGYSELEISQKRDALEDVLMPDTEAAHFERFVKAGLSRPRRWFQGFSFASYIAFR